MNALAKLIGSTGQDSDRTSARIRDELGALPQPQRHNEMLVELGSRRTGLASLSGPQLQAAEREVADMEASTAAYRIKHSRVFDQSDALLAELIQVQQREREDMIAARLRFHQGAEQEDCNRRAREANAAARELFAQRIATHLLAKSWGIDVPWTFGFPPIAAETRAREIFAQLQS